MCSRAYVCCFLVPLTCHILHSTCLVVTVMARSVVRSRLSRGYRWVVTVAAPVRPRCGTDTMVTPGRMRAHNLSPRAINPQHGCPHSMRHSCHHSPSILT